LKPDGLPNAPGETPVTAAFAVDFCVLPKSDVDNPALGSLKMLPTTGGAVAVVLLKGDSVVVD
jgi:hypothetical protein